MYGGASEIQQNLLKYVQQYQEKQDSLSIFDDPSAVSTNIFPTKSDSAIILDWDHECYNLEIFSYL